MTTLYYKAGTSDKVYQAQIVPNGTGFDVTFAYGRRNSTLNTGKKTQTPVSEGEAQKIFDKLIRSKLAEGYHEGEDLPTYTVAAEQADRFTGVLPMLLNPIDERELELLLVNENWGAEEKFDGKRMLLRKNADGSVDAINRKGLIVGAPETVINTVKSLPGTFILDGEIIGETYYAFDLLTDEVYIDRKIDLAVLLRNVHPANIIHVEAAFLQPSKQRLYDELKEHHAEGIVFKHQDGHYHAGRPASGGVALKFKFVEDITCVVTRINTQRSVGISLVDPEGFLVEVGNVTIPPNYEVPTLGTHVDVRYLYATSGNILYQPVYKGPRDDTAVNTVTSLKRKSGEEEEN